MTWERVVQLGTTVGLFAVAIAFAKGIMVLLQTVLQ